MEAHTSFTADIYLLFLFWRRSKGENDGEEKKKILNVLRRKIFVWIKIALLSIHISTQAEIFCRCAK
jgi:hypothetical protein